MPSNNDDAFHWLFIRRASEALASGENPIDFWTPQLELGFSSFLHYQHLPHLTVVLLHRALFGTVDLLTVFNLVRYLLLALLPLTVFWSLRYMGFSWPAATFAACASPLISTPFLFGFDYDSYVWRGYGTYTQLWAQHLSFIAIATTTRVITSRSGHLLAIVALSALVLSHLLYAYIVAVSIGIIFLANVRRDRWLIQVRDLTIVGGAALAITAYLWLPYIQSDAYLNASPYLQVEKYDGLGAPKVLGYLFTGQLFDADRSPILTLLIPVGIAAVWRGRTRVGVTIVLLFVIWLILYFGRPTLGRFYDFVPLSKTLFIHRFSGAVHLWGTILVGIGAGWLWEQAPRSWRPRVPYAATVVALVLLIPLMLERGAFYDQGLQWMRITQNAIVTDTDAKTVVDALRTLPRGRVFAGLRTDFGPQMNFGVPFNSARFSDLLVYEGVDVVNPPYSSSSLSSDFLWDFNYLRAEDYDLFNVRYAVMPADLQAPSFLTAIRRTTRYTLYGAPTTGYGEWVSVSERRAATAPRDLLGGGRPWLLAPDRPNRGFIRWDYPRTGVVDAALPPSCSRGTARDETIRAARVELSVSCESAGTLLIKMTYDPGLHVTIDGNATETFMLSPTYLGIVVPAGSHQVVARYESVPIKAPLLGMGALILAAAVPASRRLRGAWA